MENQNIETQHQLLTKIEELERKIESLEKSGLKTLFPLEDSRVCIKILDLNFNLQYMSGFELKTIKSKNASDFYEKPYPFYFYPDIFKTLMLNDLAKVKETRKTIAHEAFILDVNKNELWLQSTLIPISNSKDELDYIIVASVDTTAYKDAEIKIRKSQEFNESLLKISPDFIYVYDILKQKKCI